MKKLILLAAAILTIYWILSDRDELPAKQTTQTSSDETRANSEAPSQERTPPPIPTTPAVGDEISPSTNLVDKNSSSTQTKASTERVVEYKEEFEGLNAEVWLENQYNKNRRAKKLRRC